MTNQIDSFLNMMRAEVGASANTIDAYRRDLEQFEALCRFQDYKDIKGEDIAGYVQELNRQSYAAKSVARKLSAVRDFFKFLYTEKVIKNNPTTDILTPKQEKPLPKYLTPEEVRLLIDTAAAAESPAQRRLAAMLELMYACGLRVSELVCLPESCIDFDKKQILVRGIVPVSGLQRHQRRRHCRVRSRAEPAKLCGEVGGPQAFGRQRFFQVFVYRKSDKKQSDNRYSDAQTRKTAAQIFDSGGSQAFNRYGRSRRKPGTAAAGGDAGTDVCLRLARVGAGVSA